MRLMFNNCNSLISLDVSKFDTKNVQDMDSMFCNCQSIRNLDVSKFNTSKVKSMQNMFDNCKSLEYLDISKFDTRNLIDMSNMFVNCKNLTYLDLSNFIISKNTIIKNKYSCYQLFDGCKSLKTIKINKKHYDKFNEIIDKKFLKF